MEDFPFKDETYQIIGACFTVYNTMGNGFLESVYQECLELEFKKSNIPFQSQKELELFYDGILLKHKYVTDFICYDSIIVEIKATDSIADEHRGQILNYLNIAKFSVGLLINFGTHPKMQYERFVL